MKGICRVEQPERNDFGWFIRVNYHNQLLQHYVSDSAHGGKRKALQRAKTLRDELERQLGRPRTDRVIAQRPPRSPYGVAGVTRRTVREVRNGRLYERDYFEVTWCPRAGRFLRKMFSVAKLGAPEAFRLACALRLQKEREVYGQEIQTEAVQRALARGPRKKRK